MLVSFSYFSSLSRGAVQKPHTHDMDDNGKYDPDEIGIRHHKMGLTMTVDNRGR